VLENNISLKLAVRLEDAPGASAFEKKIYLLKPSKISGFEFNG